ncbi:MAG: PD-(D/E)XK nuclease family protein [bacterium]|nr:PD-(D/E)XK nuclease family protein [Candidatus Minthenecus merdequi]
MIAFIDSLAQKAIEGYGKTIDLHDETYVFPNRRAGLFFKRALSRLSQDGSTIILPHVTDINRFVEELSPLRCADDTELLLWLFKAFCKVDSSDIPHQLKSFIELGTKILHDFNEIDKYLVDAKSLFKNIDDLSGLTANTDNDIRHFYDSLLANSDNNPLIFHQRFSTLWRIMFPLYDTFGTLLRQQGIAYEGMLFRDLSDAKDLPVFAKKITFAGFNILTESEKHIIEKFSNRRMVFDYNTVERQDTDFDYHSLNIRNFKFNIPTNINEYPCITSADEGDSLHRALQSIATNNLNIEDNTAIVLADESMLVETLANIKNVKRLNITMGYPLANTQIANFVNLAIRMQLSIETDSDGVLKIYHKTLLDLLSHPYLKLFLNDFYDDQTCRDSKLTQIIKNIRQQNISRIPVETLKPLDETLFTRNNDAFAYLLSILNRLLENIDNKNNPTTDVEVIDHHFIRQYTQQIEKLKSYLDSVSITADQSETYALIRRLTRSIKAQFNGEPLQGLQIMGLLECRLLDFDNIIFVGFNDQFVPGNNNLNNSIIPYSLRKPYGLPSHEITNSIYSYNFYRMLHRCKRLDIIYTTATNEDSKTEVSRFYNQLKYIYNKKINNANEGEINHIDQSANLFTPYFEPNATPLSLTNISASSLKKFITCPLSFYYTYLLNIREQDQIDDTISDSTFGNLVHRALEYYYKKTRENHILPPDSISSLIDNVCEQAYTDVTGQRHNRGYNILAFNSLRTIVHSLVQFDESRPKFYDVRTESSYYAELNDFHIKAIIDRIDHLETGEYIIIDYKTSLDVTTASLDRMFSMDKVKKYDLEVMQILLYCAILSRIPSFANAKLVPQLLKIYSLTKQEDAKTLTPIRIEIDGNTIEINDYENVKEQFEEKLNETLTDLRNNINNPTQFLRCTSNKEHCNYCPFNDLCMETN